MLKHKKTIIYIILISLIVSGFVVLNQRRFSSVDPLNIEELKESYNFVDVSNVRKFESNIIKQDLQLREESSPMINSEWMVMLTQENNGDSFLLLVPKSILIEPLYLNEYSFPDEDRIISIIDDYNSSVDDDITYVLTSTSETSNIGFIDEFNLLDNENSYFTYFSLVIGYNVTSSKLIYLSILDNGDYLLNECDEQADECRVIYSVAD